MSASSQLLVARNGCRPPGAAGTGGADLEVDAGGVLGGGPVQKAHVSDDLRRGLAQQQRFHVFHRLVVDALVRDPFTDLRRAVENILVAEAGGGVDAINDHIGPVPFDHFGQIYGSNVGQSGLEILAYP